MYKTHDDETVEAFILFVGQFQGLLNQDSSQTLVHLSHDNSFLL